jgi:outer membrane protein assembly factor BamA
MELKYSRRMWGENWLVSRFLVGAGHAYSNSTVMPYSEQFYIGGANSIRAFTVRSLGPGSYRPSTDNPNYYFDQTANFKMEANVEMRLKIYGGLQFALFLDAGNIWLLQDDPARPGGKLNKNTFFKDIALGTGCGVRYDLSVIVLRLDLGIGIHAPYSTDRTGYYNMPKKFKDSLGLHFAIGYPF